MVRSTSNNVPHLSHHCHEGTDLGEPNQRKSMQKKKESSQQAYISTLLVVLRTQEKSSCKLVDSHHHVFVSSWLWGKNIQSNGTFCMKISHEHHNLGCENQLRWFPWFPSPPGCSLGLGRPPAPQQLGSTFSRFWSGSLSPSLRVDDTENSPDFCSCFRIPNNLPQQNSNLKLEMVDCR